MRLRRRLGNHFWIGRFLFDWLLSASLQGVWLGAGLLARVCVGVGAGIGLGAPPGGGVAILGIVCCCLVGRPGAARSFAVGGCRRIVGEARRSGLVCRCACPIVAGIRRCAAVDQGLETIVPLQRIGLGGSWRRGLKRQACCCFWRDAEHRRPLGMKLDHEISKDRAIPSSKKYLYISISYARIVETAGPPFLPGGKICRLRCE